MLLLLLGHRSGRWTRLATECAAAPVADKAARRGSWAGSDTVAGPDSSRREGTACRRRLGRCQAAPGRGPGRRRRFVEDVFSFASVDEERVCRYLAGGDATVICPQLQAQRMHLASSLGEQRALTAATLCH
jgi:hypothetical protein